MSTINPRIIAFLRRYHFIIVIVWILLVFALEGFFLYRYFYTTLIEARLLLTLKQQTSVEELKLPLYENIRNFHQSRKKKRSIDWNALRDPFRVATETTSSVPQP